MAKGTVIKRTDAYGKEEQRRKSEAKLSQKLQADLESAILRLFRNSEFCDLELIVESDSILTHSCILQARVSRFYKYLFDECQVFRKNGFSSVSIYNASFVSIRSFVENIYKNVEISEIEECVLQNLLGGKSEENRRAKTPEPPVKKSLIALTPEADLFYTPQCSPSDIQKSFDQPASAPYSPIKRKDNDITCYYKIVSVDDIQIDEKTDQPEKVKDFTLSNEGEHLEKELAEQDELFLSFKSIFSKVDKSTQNTGSYVARKKGSLRPARKLEPNASLVSDCPKPKAKLPLWRPNPTVKETGGSQVDKPSSPRSNAKKNGLAQAPKKLENFVATCQGVKNRADYSEMDLSATGGDSGLENSSSCQPEISPRENTSETSGIDLTDTTANEEIPHDEETVSTKPAEYINSSSSSDMGTWDANDENRMEIDKECKAPDSDSTFLNHASVTDPMEDKGLFRETLNEDEVARLDEMERNIKECETFLNKEREIFYCFDNTEMARSDSKVSLKVNRGFDETKSAFETVQGSLAPKTPEETVVSEHVGKLSVDPEPEDNSYEGKSRSPFSDDEINSNDIGNGSVSDIDVISRNLINSETKIDNYPLFKQNSFSECCKEEATFSNNNFTSLNERECDPSVHSKEPPHMKTPPCSPKQTNKLYEEEEEEEEESKRCRTMCELGNELYGEELDAEKKSDLNFPEVKSNYQYSNSIIPTVNNFFIDASSLLDEDEIISPPVSLLNFKTNKESESRKDESDEASICNDENPPVQEEEHSGDDKIQQIQEEERRQGDLIFKNSIPCFSRHEIEKTMERLRGGADSSRENWSDDNEQVVPSSDYQVNDDNYTQELNSVNETRPIDSYLDFSVPFHILQDLESSRDDVPDGVKEECGENVVKRKDAESLPIVSGGALPEDFSNTSSHISSPHLRRRNESAPILSGGMDYVEDEKKVQRRPNVSQSAAWTVSFDDEKVRKRRLSSTTTVSESNMESLESECNAACADESKEVGTNVQDMNTTCKTVNNGCANEAKESHTEKNDRKLPNPIEKSASLGYFIEFPKENYVNGSEEEKETDRMKENTRKNIFSMFIDMKDDQEEIPGTVPTFERQNTYDKESEVQEEVVKKPFYMFIESDSPSVKRKTNLPVVQKKLLKTSEEKLDSLVNAAEVRRKTNSEFEERMCNKNLRGSSQSLNSNESYAEKESKPSQQTRYSKLPLPLCKSSSLSAVNGEAKMVVWSEKKELKSESSLPEETWLKTNDVQVTYKGKKEGAKDVLFDGHEFHTAKGPGMVPGEPTGMYRKRESRMPGNARSGFHLRTLDEVKSPFKSPEERDSGVIVTEESDDSFVKLSDMDNYKNPYLEGNGKKKQASAMSQSIPESGWIESKTFVKGDDFESPMSKSVGVGVVKSNSGTTFASDRNFSHSLSRLFPNLNLSGTFARKANSSISPVGKQDTDPSDTQTSEVSEMSSMQSSVEPSLLETSTSGTDVSCPNGTSRLGEDLLRMFLEEISPDVIVEVGGRRIKAHKCVLSSRCQYFAARLSGGWVESAGNVISLHSFDPECYESERDILSDIKTKFVPPKYTCVSMKPRRRTRYTSVPFDLDKLYAQVLDRRKRRRLHRKRLNALERYQRNEGKNELKTIHRKRSRGGEKSRKTSKKRNDPWFLNDRFEKYPSERSKGLRVNEDVDHEKELFGEEEEGEQLNIGQNYESWLLMRNPSSGEREVFHAFWKGEGNSKSIRKAQTKMMLSFMDPSVDPCQDFYQFACGNWGLKNPIPKDKAGYDTFEMLRESLDIVLQDLLMEEDNDTMNEATIKTRNLYRSCMNNKILEERREKPLLVLLESLGGWPMIDPNWKAENFDWIVLMANLRLYNNDILISEWVGPDIKNSDEYVIQFDQTSLGLPTREYFLEPCNYVYLEAYKNYLIKISTLLGSSLENAKAEAEDLMIFETGLAEITSSPDERRNVSELYDRMTISELSATVPEINWMKYLTIVLAREVDPEEPVVMFALRYVQDLVKLLCQTEPRVVSNYLLWRFIRHRVNNLDDRFQEAKQHFYYILFGREEAPPRWKNCVAQVNTNMGMGLGAMFVSRYFDEKSKNDTLEMTHDIMRSFREILNNTSWIDDDTKSLAIQKVDAMMLRIGYPDFILNREALNERYAEVHIDPELYFENTLNILRHLTRAEQDRLGTKVNKSMWNTPPAVVNAYYSRNKNQIMFPAGILQPPFYHRYFPRSLNYGGIGVVIGHEITHGFDDKGRLFDQDGNLHKWWKEPAIEAFHQRAQCLIDQYSKYTVTEVAMQIDGVNTQGENIADNGGIKQAFKAYERWLSIHGDKDEVLQGINATNLQLFFLNFAQIWCGIMRPEATRNKLKTAVHSPGKFRVIGTLSNSEDFARVFQCEPGSPMNPIKKCSVW